jgi:hypothetical protein
VMWTPWGKRKLRPAVGLVNRYQSLTFPETAASDTNASNKLDTRRRIVPPLGD